MFPKITTVDKLCINTLKLEVRINNIIKPSSYLSKNTPCLHYKDKLINVVLYCENHTKHTNELVGITLNSLMLKWIVTSVFQMIKTSNYYKDEITPLKNRVSSTSLIT
jgi:hypothetical protein